MVDSWRGASFGGYRRCRSDPERRWAVLHSDPGRHGSRGRQDRAARARRRREGVGATLLGPGERHLHLVESQQEEPRPRPQVARWARGPAPPGRPGRRVRAEPKAGSHRRARTRLRGRLADQPEDRVLLDHRVRSAGTAQPSARIRSVDAGVQRFDVGQRPSRSGAGARRHVDRRHGHRHVGGAGYRRRAPSA